MSLMLRVEVSQADSWKFCPKHLNLKVFFIARNISVSMNFAKMREARNFESLKPKEVQYDAL